MICKHLTEVFDLMNRYDIRESRDDPHESVKLVCGQCKSYHWVCDGIKEFSIEYKDDWTIHKHLGVRTD